MLRTFRAEMQTAKSDVLAKNLTLTAEQAAKFWPAFGNYQKLQNEIIGEQLKGIQQYVTAGEGLDDATALTLMNAHFARDTKMNALRQQWLAEFQKILPTRLAVRAMQIDRRLSLLSQLEIASRIPLVHRDCRRGSKMPANGGRHDVQACAANDRRRGRGGWRIRGLAVGADLEAGPHAGWSARHPGHLAQLRQHAVRGA
jgi:hypothetical protein